jgi:hypothetical protein
VVLVQYHLHAPSADPLTNHDTELRANYYGVGGTPSLFLNGRAAPNVGGTRDRAQDVYTRLVGGLAEELETPARASLKLTATRNGGRIDIAAEADGLPRRGALRLRLVLLEDVVRYAGSNGQRLHRHVVRSLPGGVKGTAVVAPAGRCQATVDVAALRKLLQKELAERPEFKDGEWPLALNRLKVVALLQDDTNKEILQAAQVDVPD